MNIYKCQILAALLLISASLSAYKPLYFCTAADAKFFNLLKSFIGSVHKTNFDHLGEIAVFNLGLTQEQIDEINSMQKVHVYEVERTHPDILKPVYAGKKHPDFIKPIGPDKKYKIPGWYAWKPVAIKQALDMFPYVLWQDAGNAILKPLEELFEHIRQNGYFLIGSGYKNRHYTTQYVVKKFGLDQSDKKWILDAYQCDAGAAIGIARDNDTAYNEFLLAIYELTRDLRNFSDDGSCPAFGYARHDQTLFSIFAHLLGLNIMRTTQRPTQIFLTIDGKKIPFYADFDPKVVDGKTQIYYGCKGKLDFSEYIKYQN